METAAFIMVLLVAVSADFHVGKHVFILKHLPWKQAWMFCRENFTELSPITSSSQVEHLTNVSAGLGEDRFWTGLFWNGRRWRWTQGSADDVPPDVLHSASLCLHSCQSNKWEIKDQQFELPFLCINLVIVEVRKSWEEALVSCRQNHTSLTSLTSRHEVLIAKQKIQEEHITDPVWIGLRFLRNHWMWVNMDPLEYQAWPEASRDHQCPVKGRCGALNKQGRWENWDCQEKLSFICF